MIVTALRVALMRRADRIRANVDPALLQPPLASTVRGDQARLALSWAELLDAIARRDPADAGPIGGADL